MRLFGFDININRKLTAAEQKRSKIRGVEEIGDSGTSTWNGIIDEEYNPDLADIQGIDIYEQMRKSDGTVRAALLVTSLPIRRAKWYVEPASDEQADIDIAEFVSKNLFEYMSITWADLLRQALLSLPFGVMVFEKVFEIRDIDGREYVVWKKFAPRLPKSIHAWEMENHQPGIQQHLRDGTLVNIPMEKLCIFVNEKEGDNWWGMSLLRPAYKHWYMKTNLEKIDAMAIERQGLGIPYAKMPLSPSDEDRAKAKTILENMRAHEKAYIMEPNEWEIGFKDMMAKGNKEAMPSISYHNREIVKAVLAQFLELGANEVGSRALSEDHSQLFLQSLESVADSIADVFNTYAIPQLVDFNFSNVTEYPKLAYTGISRVDAQKISSAYSSLVHTGAVEVLDKDEQYFREVMGLPERTEEDVPREPKEQPEDPDTKQDKEDAGVPDKKDKKKASEPNDSFKSFRKLTFAEEKVDFEKLQDAFSRFQEAFHSAAKELLNEERDRYMASLTKALTDNDVAAIKALTFQIQTEYRQLIKESAQEAFEFGKNTASREMKVERPSNPREIMRQLDMLADTTSDQHLTNLVAKAKQGIVEGLGRKETRAAVIGAIDALLDEEIEKVTSDTASILLSGYINKGRNSVFERNLDDIYALQRSELLDLKTCNYCLSVDARIVEKDDPFAKNTIFHSNCRGIWVEILQDEEEKPSIGGIPKSLRDRFGDVVNDLVQLKKPLVRKDSAAGKFLNQ